MKTTIPSNMNWFPIAESVADKLLKTQCRLTETQTHAQRLSEALKRCEQAIADLEGTEVEYPRAIALAAAAQNARESISAWEAAQ